MRFSGMASPRSFAPFTGRLLSEEGRLRVLFPFAECKDIVSRGAGRVNAHLFRSCCKKPAAGIYRRLVLHNMRKIGRAEPVLDLGEAEIEGEGDLLFRADMEIGRAHV